MKSPQETGIGLKNDMHKATLADSAFWVKGFTFKLFNTRR